MTQRCRYVFVALSPLFLIPAKNTDDDQQIFDHYLSPAVLSKASYHEIIPQRLTADAGAALVRLFIHYSFLSYDQADPAAFEEITQCLADFLEMQWMKIGRKAAKVTFIPLSHVSYSQGKVGGKEKKRKIFGFFK